MGMKSKMLKIDLNCPVEVTNYSLVKCESDEVIAFISLHNMSEYIVTDIKLCVIVFDQDDNELGKVTGNINELLLPPGEEYRCRMSLKGTENIDNLDIVFETIFFAGDLSWQREKNVKRIPHTIPQTLDSQLDDLRDIAGEECRCFAADLVQYWRCTCGRTNKHEDENCSRCGAEREYVLNHYTSEAVANAVVLQNKNKIKSRMAVRKAMVYILPVVVIILVIGGYFVKSGVFPYISYSRADNYLDAGNYSKAKEMFEELEDYKDSEFLAQCANAYSLVKNDKYDEAVLELQTLAENNPNGYAYEDAIKECGYMKGTDLFDSEDYISASDFFAEVGDYKDSSDLLKKSYYNIAMELLESENPFASIEYFEKIPGYDDVDTRLCTMPLQMCGTWRIVSSSVEESGITFVVNRDSTLNLPEGFAGIDTDKEMHLEWKDGIFNIYTAREKKLGSIMIVNNTSKDEITISISASNSSSGEQVDCVRVG